MRADCLAWLQSRAGPIDRKSFRTGSQRDFGGSTITGPTGGASAERDGGYRSEAACFCNEQRSVR